MNARTLKMTQKWHVTPEAIAQATGLFLLGEEIVEGFYRGEFVVLDVEDGVELGDLQDVVNFLGEAVKLEFAPRVADRGKAADQFADAGRVDVIDLGEVEDDLFLASGDELANGVAKLSGFVAEGDAAGEVEDGHVADFARGDGHRLVSNFRFSLAIHLRGDGRREAQASQWWRDLSS